MKVEFTVEDRPPRKYSGKSMYNKPGEVKYVVLLRKKAFEAREKLDLREPFHSHTALELTVFAPRDQLESMGDLDSFITGVCDGLQKAHPLALRHLDHELYKEHGRERIDPENELLLDDDAKIVSITARKVSLDEDQDQKIHYKVTIEPV